MGSEGDESALGRKLSTLRYESALRGAEALLDGMGVGSLQRRILRLDEVDVTWPRYLTRLQQAAGVAESWTQDQAAAVQHRLDVEATVLGMRRVTWFTMLGARPIGIEVPASPLLRAAVGYLVTPAGDLMLSSQDGESGLCVELSRGAGGAVYEMAAWGSFSR